MVCRQNWGMEERTRGSNSFKQNPNNEHGSRSKKRNRKWPLAKGLSDWQLYQFPHLSPSILDSVGEWILSWDGKPEDSSLMAFNVGTHALREPTSEHLTGTQSRVISRHMHLKVTFQRRSLPRHNSIHTTGGKEILIHFLE